jgi:hypothetical protein
MNGKALTNDYFRAFLFSEPGRICLPVPKI